MGMMVKALTKWAKSDLGTKFYKWSTTEKGQRFLTTRLPGLETLTATVLYVYSTAKRKEIPDRQRSMLQTQNIASGIVGYFLGSYASSKVSNYLDKTLIPNLDPKVVPDVHKVKMGLQVGLPILITAVLMRGIIPSIVAWGSGKWEEYKASKKEASANRPPLLPAIEKKLNFKA